MASGRGRPEGTDKPDRPAGSHSLLDPNAAVFHPSQCPPESMNFNDLVYYHYSTDAQPYDNRYSGSDYSPYAYSGYGNEYGDDGQPGYDYSAYYGGVGNYYDENADPNSGACSFGGEGGAVRRGRGQGGKGFSRNYSNNRPGSRRGQRANARYDGVNQNERSSADSQKREKGGRFDRAVEDDQRPKNLGDSKQRERDSKSVNDEQLRGTGPSRRETGRGRVKFNRDSRPSVDRKDENSFKNSSHRNERREARKEPKSSEKYEAQESKNSSTDMNSRLYEDNTHCVDSPRVNGGNLTKEDLRQGSEKAVDVAIEDAEVAANSVKDFESQKIDEFDFRRSKTKGGEEVESQRGRLVEELMNSTYECMVCCDVIRREVAVWSCSECYHVFHLYCIKKWARSPSALVEGTETGWRCPGCQNVTVKVPNQYICFCTKQKDPQFSPYETPHSCGEVCGKTRGGHCKHSCNILCHPGPCPSCNAIITVPCKCGKSTRTVKCSQGADVKCEEKCWKDLNCGKHRCERVCHEGICQPCDVEKEQYCYCGKGFRKVLCGSKESFVERYGCGKICDKKLTCENHFCEKVCHGDQCGDCVLAPENVTTCRCGKTEIAEFADTVRTSCTDPIPTCDKACYKELICGPEAGRHRCSQTCHQGSCPVCSEGVTHIFCRCGATITEMSCKDAEKYLTGGELYLCNRRCNKKRQCGKHKCQTPCCTDEIHACTQICGRKLTCGLHRCEDPCHRGNCQSCWNVCFEEVTCHCGAAFLDPPIPCGTKPPECRQICQRSHPCEHPVRHSCHSEEKCPPCTELTKKRCLGDHELRHNIPCHIAEISCGMPCGRQLLCRQHKCIKTCHKGECMVEDEVCEQRCRKPRTWCDHLCGVPCHPGVACPETLCEAQIEVKCVCGNRREIGLCGAGKRDAEAKVYQQMTSSSMIGKIIYVGNGQTIDLNSLNSKKRQLECNEECAKVDRNRRLALALQIENPDLSDKLGAPNYTEFLKDFAKTNRAFAAEIEKALSELVQNVKSSKYQNRSHSFKPMKRDQRRFIHEIASYYGCKTQSYDFEPVKSVVATAWKGQCWMPNMTLTASIKRQTQPSAPLPIPLNSTEKDIRAKVTASRLSTTVNTADNSVKTKTKAKYVDYFDFNEDSS